MKSNHILLFIAGIIILSFSVSCYYDSEEFLYGKPDDGTCADTAVVTYSAGVQPILSKYCYSCHSNASSASMGGGIRLESYTDVKSNASNGSLYGAITHNPNYSSMPKDGSKLKDCYIIVIKKWIDAGTLNN